ncbi:MAG: A/G-specific adenine glycosylase [Deltaproteobacteria bacterium]|nr:A/G-specific adenine glycosylase [Deltaproteobacteria bacterium]
MKPSLTKKRIQTKLLQWFQKNKRDLPWRKTLDPYAIWISEIMLQQTQVNTVIPYYNHFLKTFPTIRYLAKANLSKVLKVWEGLGYYSRARNLHQASRIIANHLKGKIPKTPKDLLSLPGIGRYTAGAVLSIAYNKEAPILDGNVKRVLSRLFVVSGHPKKTEEILWPLSESLIPKGSPGAFNQALMDLGSMTCTPKNPNCLGCPLKNLCQGYLSGKPESYPLRSVKKKVPHIEAIAAVIQKDGKVLIHQRPPHGLLGGLWEFPNWRIERKKDLKEYLRQKVKRQIGLIVKCKEPLGSFKQTYSHFKLTLHVYHCQVVDGIRNGKWIPIRNLHQLPMSRIYRRIANALSDA